MLRLELVLVALVDQLGHRLPLATGSSWATTSDDSAKALSSADREFVQKAALGGMAEVELGKLAQHQASSEQVKGFGERMVQDYSYANSAKGDTGVKPAY